MRWVYSLLAYLLLPVLLGYFLWRSRVEPEYRKRWHERIGFIPKQTPGQIWIHAASVGELQAAKPLIDALLERQFYVWVTTFTPTGSDQVQSIWKGRVGHSYLPVDTPGAVSRFLRRLQPGLGMVMESEFWPNLYAGCAQRDIKLVWISARLSERSLSGYKKWLGQGLIQQTMDAVSQVAAQSEADAQRLISAGIHADKVCVTGNIKLDVMPDASVWSRGQAIRQCLGQGPVWVAASTHADEEIAALEAHQRVRQNVPEAVLVLVPRHPQRFEEVALLCQKSGLTFCRHSEDLADMQNTPVVLVDALGVLLPYLAACDVAFVGGSLANIGGHNLLEPAMLGLPVLTGPHVHTWQGVADFLEKAGGLRYVEGVQSLSDQVTAWFTDEAARQACGQAALQAVEQNRGSLVKTLAILEPMLCVGVSPAQSDQNLARRIE